MAIMRRPTSTGAVWVGVDLGGTKLMCAVLDSKFRVLAEDRTSVPPAEGQQKGLKRMAELIENTLKQSGVRRGRLAAIGVGCPGPLDLQKGLIVHAPNLGWRKVPLKKFLEGVFGRPVVVSNDVDAGTFGEYVAGAAQGARTVLGIFPGTGIGGACIYEGRLIRGARQSCMEIGHVKVWPGGPLCGCGRRGCLEAVAGRLAIAAQAAAAAYRGDAPALLERAGTDISKIRSKALADAIRDGDCAVERIVRRAARHIGLAAANAINLLAPDVVVLGGGLVEAMPKLFLEEVEEEARDKVMPSFRDTFKVVAAKLGDRATIIGAAALAARAVQSGEVGHEAG